MNASTEAGVKQQLQMSEFLQEMKSQDMKKVLSMPEGRRILYSLLVLGNVFEVNFFGNSRDFYHKGIQFMAMTILKEIAAVEGYAILDKMKREFNDQTIQAELASRKDD